MKKEKFTVEEAAQKLAQMRKDLEEMQPRFLEMANGGLSSLPAKAQSAKLMSMGIANMASAEFETMDSCVQYLSTALPENPDDDDRMQGTLRMVGQMFKDQFAASPEAIKQYMNNMLSFLIPHTTALIDEARVQLQYADVVLGGECCEENC